MKLKRKKQIKYKQEVIEALREYITNSIKGYPYTYANLITGGFFYYKDKQYPINVYRNERILYIEIFNEKLEFDISKIFMEGK